jgi:DNA-binding response OmpR family regulator
MTESTPFLTDPSGHPHLLAGETITLGRAPECNIVLAGARVSREHARLRRAGRQVLLEDLRSTNGTYLNGERVLSPVALHEGDRLGVGEVELTFHDPDTTFRDDAAPDLELNLEAHIVRVNRRVAQVSPKEFALLAYLYAHRNQVCSKDDLGRAIWPENQGEIFDYQIENLMRRLRARVEPDPSQARLLLTVRGLGYKLVAPE